MNDWPNDGWTTDEWRGNVRLNRLLNGRSEVGDFMDELWCIAEIRSYIFVFARNLKDRLESLLEEMNSWMSARGNERMNGRRLADWKSRCRVRSTILFSFCFKNYFITCGAIVSIGLSILFRLRMDWWLEEWMTVLMVYEGKASPMFDDQDVISVCGMHDAYSVLS